jgi:hypothetical protein
MGGCGWESDDHNLWRLILACAGGHRLLGAARSCGRACAGAGRRALEWTPGGRDGDGVRICRAGGEDQPREGLRRRRERSVDRPSAKTSCANTSRGCRGGILLIDGPSTGAAGGRSDCVCAGLQAGYAVPVLWGAGAGGRIHEGAGGAAGGHQRLGRTAHGMAGAGRRVCVRGAGGRESGGGGGASALAWGPAASGRSWGGGVVAAGMEVVGGRGGRGPGE